VNAIKEYGGVDEWLHSLFQSALDALCSGTRALSTHCIKFWSVPVLVWALWGRGKSLAQCQQLNTNHPAHR